MTPLPDAPLPDASPVRVAVIDSGVHTRHPHIATVAGGISIAADGTLSDDYTDRLGHGTAVMAAIQEKAPGADYFAVRVFHGSLRTSALALYRAIEWCAAKRMDIVNLSLGTRNADHAEGFRHAVEVAHAAGVALVSPREMDGVACYPGCLPGVLGVILDEQCPREEFGVRETAEGAVFVASGYPRPAPGIPLERNLQGISFAAANLSGIAARTLAGLPRRSPELLRRVLLERGQSR
jgi:subtilisin family serine protease